MILTQKEAAARFLPLIDADGSLFAKFQKIWARPAVAGERIVTMTSSGKETENTAKEGDYVVQSQTNAKELYVISEATLIKRYTQNFMDGQAWDAWDEYLPKGTVRAIEYHPTTMGCIERFVAAWGEEMVVNKGDMLCTTDEITTPESEVYRIDRVEFEQTYRIKR